MFEVDDVRDVDRDSLLVSVTVEVGSGVSVELTVGSTEMDKVFVVV